MEIALRVHVVRRILSNISGYTGPIFAIFSPYESSLCTDDGYVLLKIFSFIHSVDYDCDGGRVEEEDDVKQVVTGFTAQISE